MFCFAFFCFNNYVRNRLGTTSFYRLVKKGKITILKIEGKTLVDADELDEAIETRSVFRYQH